ncbi:MAG TPA: hypothetical protein VFH80_06595 [Solirubrobacteraceae bacterium]|nr:hypothetical protein [Solirubrobacteraceae bacterium]
MFVVVASRTDAAARALCERAPPGSAQLLSWRDLSTPGWRYYGDPGDGDDGAVIADTPITNAEITAVLTRCPAVPPHELGHIVPADRSYVAAEMTALLVAWLTRLRCPVFNRPQDGCLCGPRWPPERWTMLASSLGLRAVPVERRAVPGLAPSAPRPTAPPGFELRTVTVVGARVLASTKPPETLVDAALTLASAAGVTLLKTEFAVRGSEHVFVSAGLDVDLAAGSVADALLAAA